MENSMTNVRFISSCILPPTSDQETSSDGNLEGRKVSIVLARPKTGRWHQVRQQFLTICVSFNNSLLSCHNLQVRQHLSGLGHPIIGDSSHGRSRTNRIWKKERKLMKERTCLHLSRVQLPASEYTPTIDVSSPLSQDMVDMLNEIPQLLMEKARSILEEESILI
jgi:hypothetical protein